MNADTQAISDREKLHRSIVQTSPHAIFLFDAETRRLIDANPATATLLGYPLEELVEKQLADIDLAGPEEHDRMVDHVRRHRQEMLGDRTLRRRDGRAVPVEASTNLILLRDRQVICYFARNISERLAASEEAERMQRALALSQKHEAVGRLAAGIAHDFNNQLMVILMCAESVGYDLDPGSENQEAISDLMSAGKSAAGLVRQLLAFSGKQVLRPALIEVDHAVEAQRRMLVRTLGEDVAVETSCGAGHATVFVDQTQLDQVIMNLAVNARDAMPDGGTFSIETSLVEVGDDFTGDYVTLSPGEHVLLKVTDTGTGMSPDTLAHIFEPFFTTKRAGEGTGLGLATIYGIIKQSGGSIWASSELGVGTTFRIYLPITDSAPEVSLPPEERRKPLVQGGTETLLVVDDDEMVRVIAARLLRDLGYTVLEAGNQKHAVDVFRSSREGGRAGVDLVLTDVVMPGGSGPDLVRDLEQIEEGLRVIFMSGYSYGRVEVENIVAKDYTFLEKPLGRAQLARAVRTTLDRALPVAAV